MCYPWIDIRNEIVFTCVDCVPERGGARCNQFDLYKRLGPFEAVFPRYGHSDRCTMLFGQLVSVDTCRHEREIVGSFGNSESFGVWPRLAFPTGSRTFRFLVIEADEFDELCGRLRLDVIE